MNLLRGVSLFDVRSRSIFISDVAALKLGISAGGCKLHYEEFMDMFELANRSQLENFFSNRTVTKETRYCTVRDNKVNGDVFMSWGEYFNHKALRQIEIAVTRNESAGDSQSGTTNPLNLKSFGQLTILLTGKIINHNLQAQDYFPEQDLNGRLITELIDAEYQKDIIRGLEALRDGEENEIKGIIKTTGQLKWVDVLAVKDVNPSGTTVTAYFTSLDKQKRREKILERKVRLLERRYESTQMRVQQLEAISFSMSHDLRNPVASAKMIMGILEDPEERLNWDEWGGSLDESLNKLEKDLNSYLELLSSIKKMQVLGQEEEIIKLDELLYGVLKTFSHQFKTERIQVSIKIDELPELVYNERLLESIFSNLISNAIKYRDYDRPLRIEIGSEYDNGPCVYCADTGIGMDLDEMGHQLFKPNKKFTDRENSTGIGLYLIKQQVEINGGRIDVQSKVGVGSLFKVYLKSNGH